MRQGELLRFFPKLHGMVATGLYSGMFPFSPGTFGSLVAVGAWYAFLTNVSLEISAQLALLGIVLLVGFYSTKVCIDSIPSDKLDDKLDTHKEIDPSIIVIDEWAGMILALINCDPTNPLQVLTAFALFRAFDIIKPGPVGWAEKIGGATGIMADDLVAGLAALLLGHLIFYS